MLPYSTLLVFTDADAKDEFLRPQVEAKVNAKHIKLELFITNQCPKPPKSSKLHTHINFI